ncbi:hypothetical protein L2D01_05955 [Hyphomonadaceae bacterium ML37]|nr:hypothetical protein L2D01_05955 [Hyphomonadaceae bacterium ML37]
MATPRQVAANRANANKITGPKTAGTKAVSARNARKQARKPALFGRNIVQEGEDPAAFDALVGALRCDMAPGRAQDDAFIDQLTMAFWRNKRLARAEPVQPDAEGARHPASTRVCAAVETPQIPSQTM